MKWPMATGRPIESAAPIASFLAEHVWPAGLLGQEVPVWRVSEDDPDSGLYAESRDVGAVISYTATHS